MSRTAFAWPWAALACLAFSPAHADDFPDGLDFTDVQGTQRGVVVESDLRTIVGLDEIVNISISCPTSCAYSLDEGPWTSAPGSASESQTIRLRQTSHANLGDSVTANLSVGSASIDWVVANVGQPFFVDLESGNNQQAPINTAFQPITVRVRDISGNPIEDQAVVFGPSPAQAGVTFAGGANSTSVDTDAEGRVTVTPSANGFGGSYGLPVNANTAANTVSLQNTTASLTHNNFVSFPNTLVGETSSVPLTVFNNGNAPGMVTGVNSSNADIGIAIGACGNIAPGGSCTLQLTYTPTAPATIFNGSLTLVTNSVPQTPGVSFTAIATRPAAQAAESVPGTTLLYPYFEVDPAGSGGVNTVLSWRNTSATALLTHVTVWSDYGVPVMSFNAYMTGFDVITMDLYSMLVQGRIPATASAGQDPGDRISNQGPFSQDINFASCSGQLPYADPVLTPAFRADLISGLAGGPMLSRGARCVGAKHGDAILRGYVTIDTVNHCTQALPTDPNYAQIALTAQNAMAGEFLLVEPQARSAAMAQAAAIEGDVSGGAQFSAGDLTFYGSFNGNTAVDGREPLPTTWAVDANADDVEVVVWRDPKRNNPADFACNVANPNGFPLTAERVAAFDNEEQVANGNTGAFPLATQRVALGSAGLPAPGRSGWIYLGLGHAAGVANSNDPAAAQAWVSVLQRLDDPSRSGADAHPLDRANAARHNHPN